MADPIFLTYCYRVKGAAAAKRLNSMSISVNYVWNYCGGITNDSRRLNRRWPSNYSLIGLTNGCSKDLGLHSDTVQAVCKKFALSRDKIKRRPRWRKSFGAKRSLGWVPFQCARPLKVSADTVTFLSKRYRLWLSRPIPTDIRSGSFNQNANGQWFLNLVCRVEADAKSGAAEIGIDLGLKDLAVLSTGEKIANPRHVGRFADKLARVQRAGRTAQARAIHRKIAARRRHFLHETSTRIVRQNALICVGDVNSAALARTKMAKSVLDAGWSAFRLMLCYKAVMHGARFVETNERMSTQTCSDCYKVGGPKGFKGLRVRDWTCQHCGSLHDRDVNAALNILESGRNIALLTEISVL